MGIFSSIKDAIFGKARAQAAPQPAPSPTTSPGFGRTSQPSGQPTGFGRAAASIDEVDVEHKLDDMTGADDLNWRSSIVDLMKLVGIDPSYENRKDLAHELGDADYSGKAEENIWLHKQVMNKLAEAGGRVPADLRD